MILSIEDGARELRLAFTVRPATEKIRSDGALVAGMARMTNHKVAHGTPNIVNLSNDVTQCFILPACVVSE